MAKPQTKSAPSLLKPVDPARLTRIMKSHTAYLSGRTGGQRAMLAYADLSNRVLEDCDLTEADLTGARLHGAMLARTKLDRAALFGADLRDADLRSTSLIRADLRGASLRGANLSGANLTECDLREGIIAIHDVHAGFWLLQHDAIGEDADFTVMAKAKLDRAQIGETFACAVDCRDTDFSRAILNGARLCNAALDGADLTGAGLFQADLTGASLDGAVVVDSNIGQALLDDGALRNVVGKAPSIVYVEDQPLWDLVAAHERWCASGGAEGQPVKLGGADFRCLKTLSRRKLTALSAPRAVFVGLDMSGVQMQGSDLTGADFRSANLAGADLRGAKLAGAQLTRANLQEAKLGPLLVGQDRFVRVDLTRASLRSADLSRADARRARLLFADLSGARLDDTLLDGAEMER